MITKVEIDGFKSFHNFEMTLHPFQVIVGPNGVGKSNLFDAIMLLSRLAEGNNLYEAFRSSRGDVQEQFAQLADGTRAQEMCFAVELLLDKIVEDDFGVQEEVSSTRVRYELVIERRQEQGFERLYVTQENLTHIIKKKDEWFHNRAGIDNWIVRNRRASYISTDKRNINKHQDGRRGRKQEFPRGDITQTVLSTISSAEYPTAYAVRQAMLNWHFLQINPEELRTPSDTFAPSDKLAPDGSNLAAILYRMAGEDKFVIDDISRDMTNVVPGILSIEVANVAGRNEFLIRAKTIDGNQFSSRVLSDGTLRILTLITLSYDPNYHGVLCFEEPENGVHPQRLGHMLDVLRSLITDFTASDKDEDNEPLRQIIVNTHSPAFLARLSDDEIQQHVAYMYAPRQQPRITRVGKITATHPTTSPVPENEFTRQQILQILDPEDYKKRYTQLHTPGEPH
jgi:predicted ATPase